jgi:metal-dependent amidase/aminoacylase/carboxypeptidase family protein
MMVHGSGRRTAAKYFLGMTELRFTFNGRASHASAYPEEGINALDAVIQTFNSINALRQHFKSDVRVHGIITDGGRAPNIIPEKAEAVFFVRAGELEELERMKKRVIGCAEGAARATGAALTVATIGESNAPLKHNRALIDAYMGSLDYLGLKVDNHPPDKNMGSSDIGNVSQVVPAIHPQVPISQGLKIHTREFADSTVTPDGHRALMEGVRALGLTAIELLLNPGLIQRIKEDFQKGSASLA